MKETLEHVKRIKSKQKSGMPLTAREVALLILYGDKKEPDETKGERTYWVEV